ncbi:hypothetical protein CHELA20_50928 [Hyphomicrobiales bacterium]|nr:hypothetical protein CHELA20_50928 [Hyphomicrobiales bacterium]CAH1675275.1 hypothetical protein CHELA41_24084 [Hyphomicrobiales bacterium]
MGSHGRGSPRSSISLQPLIRGADCSGHLIPSEHWARPIESWLYALHALEEALGRLIHRSRRRSLIANRLREKPERSNRQVAAELGVSHTTVAVTRASLEEIGQIGQSIRVERKGGGTYPARKPKPPAPPTNITAFPERSAAERPIKGAAPQDAVVTDIVPMLPPAAASPARRRGANEACSRLTVADFCMVCNLMTREQALRLNHSALYHDTENRLRCTHAANLWRVGPLRELAGGRICARDGFHSRLGYSDRDPVC